jgi:hypothetical protein
MSQNRAAVHAAPSTNWLAWIDVRGTDFSRNAFGSDLNGTQANAIAGLTRKLTRNFLVGVLDMIVLWNRSSSLTVSQKKALRLPGATRTS